MSGLCFHYASLHIYSPWCQQLPRASHCVCVLQGRSLGYCCWGVWTKQSFLKHSLDSIYVTWLCLFFFFFFFMWTDNSWRPLHIVKAPASAPQCGLCSVFFWSGRNSQDSLFLATNVQFCDLMHWSYILKGRVWALRKMYAVSLSCAFIKIKMQLLLLLLERLKKLSGGQREIAFVAFCWRPHGKGPAFFSRYMVSHFALPVIVKKR